MSKQILIVNGPNLDRLGEREPEIYGRTTLAEIESACVALADDLGVELRFCQSNSEGQIIDIIHQAIRDCDALIINPAALSFYSVAIRDALAIFKGPIIELHISNIHARDEAHRHSIQSAVATAVICGLGAYGYLVALTAAARKVEVSAEALPASLGAALA